MKKLLLFLSLAFSINAMAQTKMIDISKFKAKKFSQIECTYYKSIDIEKLDTIYCFSVTFQDANYTQIISIASIFFTNRLGGDLEFQEFIKDLKMASSEMEKKSNMNWAKKKYQLSLYDFAPNIYIYESPEKGKGYTTLSKKDLDKYIAYMETIKFGKE